ncbi:40S ribosomal protein SSA (nucleomorph) [Chroomonas mesostigmatica CCMP1168]|uniref:Small ribosomal subunit protein uS2 n=1 Tax=Chroomonas mesostigmatica CCMP1168 TaxID=1195612 RepID=J7G8B3_9CRYP|nr:40S ribosomal protein SSA [Chroomonas mesostigmatica CCMP1168]|mmetsp:Transcript_52501/g.128315  ORF Transcript_52501/g.128315 Transcript_52501/m.128315 type:complete len:210 (+) Transcript_52501:1048-1677(+)
MCVPALKIPIDVKKLLICNVHLGKKTCENLMKIYIWKRRKDGLFIINISKTMKKIALAARVISSIKNPSEILAISTQTIGQRAVIKFSQFVGCQIMVGRWTPGRLTNQSCKKFLEPQLIILSDPSIDSQPLNESSYVNIPTIAFCNTQTSLKFVDVAIPGNTSDKHAVAILWWLLAREILRIKGAISKIEEWEIPVDLFIARNQDQEEE